MVEGGLSDDMIRLSVGLEDFDDLKSLGSDFLVTVLAVHFLTFKNAARGGTLPDTPGSAMPAVSMGRRLTTKSVAFHDPGKTFAF